MPDFIATAPPGFEYLLVDELKKLGASDAKEGLTQVKFSAEWADLYGICLWTRLANRILYPISEFDAFNEEQLYDAVKKIPWEFHLNADGTLAVDYVSRKSTLKHERYGAQKVKDAIVDYFREEFGERPSVDTEKPDVRIHVRVNKNRATLCIDLSGKGLHQRGYRLKTGEAPIKENFAAAMLYRAGWIDQAELGAWLLDPMCGSGTIVIEAAMMAYDIAPGLNREYWGFLGWKPFHRNLFESQLESAEQRKEAAESRTVTLIGSDKDPQVLALARSNAERAGVADRIDWQVGAFQSLTRPQQTHAGVVITNPPYGERLDDKKQVAELYSQFGEWLKQHFIGDNAMVLSTDKQHGHAIGIRAEKIYRFMNGPIQCELLKLPIDDKYFVQSRQKDDRPWDEQLSDQAKMFANRLQKNLAGLKSFLKQQSISCYRAYDADLPEYSAAVDVYDGHLHIQEYAPPKSIDAHKALRRLRDIERVAAGVLNIPAERVFVKTRAKQKGAEQYKKQGATHQVFVVEEGAAKFEVNLSDYLDTGLFLDHRKVRQWLPDITPKGGKVLNLFCYTATASVHCALAGATTTNVDLSNTYLQWGKRNFELNGIHPSQHEFIRANCVEWLAQQAKAIDQGNGQPFDVIFMDPPTFSNSKKMEQHFDIQKDHVELILNAIKLLKPQGQLVFSNNFRKFQWEVDLPNGWQVKEITPKTTSRDFAKKPLHRSWLISPAKA